MQGKVRYALAVLLIGGIAMFAHADNIGFEVSDGFSVGGPWPTGWTPKPSGVRIGTAWNNGGSQSLEVGLNGAWAWSAIDYRPPTPITAQPGVVTEVSVDILVSSAPVPTYYNFVGFGFFMVSDIDGYSAGAVSFSLQDWEYEYEENRADDFDIQTVDPLNWSGWSATGEYFTPGSSYHFATLIDWSAGTTTLRLTDLSGSLVHQATVNSLPNGVATVRFGGPSHDNDSLPTYFDNFYVGDVPEPASVGLLALGGLALIRRRRR